MAISSALGSSSSTLTQLNFGNLLINGAMQVSQRSAVGTEVTGISTVTYNTADRWQTRANASVGIVKQATVAEAPTGSGFRNSIKTTVTTAGTTFDANQSCGILQRIEGQNLQAIRKGTASAQTVTLSFWVKSNKTGTYIAELFDADNTRQVSKAYTINVVDVWEYKTITYPADITGAFDNDNGGSLILEFWLGSSTTFTSGTLNTVWAANVSANRAVGLTNFTSTLNNYWQMTGAQLTVGSVATPFEFKSFADYLQDCMRYYEKTYEYATAAGTNTPNGVMELALIADGSGFPLLSLELKARKRSAGWTMTFYRQDGTIGQWTLTRYTSATDTNNNMTYDNKSESNARVYTTTATAAAREPCRFKGHYVVSDEL